MWIWSVDFVYIQAERFLDVYACLSMMNYNYAGRLPYTADYSNESLIQSHSTCDLLIKGFSHSSGLIMVGW